jgi:hypothetical protein
VALHAPRASACVPLPFRFRHTGCRLDVAHSLSSRRPTGDRHQSAHPDSSSSSAQPHSHSCGFRSGSNSRNASPIGSPSASPTTKGLPAVPPLIKGGLNQAGGAISSVGRLGSALKGLAKGAGNGSAV